MNFKELLYSLYYPLFFDYSSNPHFNYSMPLSLHSHLKNKEVVKGLKLNEYVSNLLDLN